MSNHDISLLMAAFAYTFANIFIGLGIVGSMQSDAEPGTKLWAFFGFGTLFFALNSWAVSTF